ncbi:replication protein [Candidatus Infernicultor aquiphilus]
MANPQKENGYTAIANEILEKIIASGLNGTEIFIILYILRKTYGYQKKEDIISLSQFMKVIPVTKPSICKALKILQLVKIIKLVKKTKLGNSYLFNKNYNEWQLVKKTKLVKKQVIKLVKKTYHTKEKEYTKEIYTTFFEKFWDLYPKRNGKKLLKQDAYQWFKKNITDKDLDNLLISTKNYANSKSVKSGYAKDAIHWLRKEWQYWIEPEQQTLQSQDELKKEYYEKNFNH